MPAPGALSVGRPVTSATTGSAVVLLPRSGQLLGFFASATTTLTLYDAATVATAVAANQLGAALTAVAVGFNPYPVDLVNGLAVTQGAQLTFIVV
jgi:hypothetical protein